jgi:4-amino-4-deoxy-L-arabinose transferase-like glycosyltransferase
LSANISAKIKAFFQDRRRVIASGLLVLILALGAFLRFYNLGANDVGNQYYAATVKSMLTSWHNFFYASFEPGGSVSVDKPPLGFWVQCLSAYFLGVTGFALALPNAIAGVLSIFVVYKLVRRPFGPWIGLAAALALAVMPAAISAERNNTIDGLLVFVLLLAAWAFLQSVYTGKVRWLFIGAFIVGLGFNIKMLQAFLPLPAFYAIYFFGAKTKWWKKILNLTAATVLLIVISLSWAVIVDLTPVASRPYVGSSTDNTEMELIVGHNGIRRFTNLFGRQDDGSQNVPAAQPNPPQGARPAYSGQLPPLQNGNRPGQLQPGQNRAPGTMDFGTAGTLRLFTEPLVGEASWLLPFVLIGLFVIVAVLWKQPFDEKHIALILWAGWLLPEAIYFTYSQGLMHAYYLIMMGAPIAALFAMTGWALWQLIQKRALVGWAVTAFISAATLIFEAGVLKGTDSSAPWAVGAAVVLLVAGIVLVAVSRKQVQLAPAALSLMLMALLVAPMLWSALTTFNTDANSALPYAGPSQQSDLPGVQQGVTQQKGIPQELIDYLEANTNPDSYLLATANANQAAPFILATDRPVFTFGGFLGTDNIIDAKGLAEMVASGKLRFVLSEGLEQRSEIIQWLQGHCILTSLPGFTGEYAGFGLPGVSRQPGELYDCGN